MPRLKTNYKNFLRKITYSGVFQKLVCWLLFGYMKLVFYSSKKTFFNEEVLLQAAKNNAALIVCFWHNRLMMAPFAAARVKKKYPHYNFVTLASRHGDGQFVGKIMEKFGFISILGSSQTKRHRSRGIEISGFRKIFDNLKQGNSLAITPDGPRGPNQKINGEIVNIARLAQVGILASSYSSSKFKKLGSWDKFTIPLPFSRLCFYVDAKPIYVEKNCSEAEMEKIKKLVETRLDFVQEESQRLATID